MIPLDEHWKEWPLEICGEKVSRRKLGNVIAEVHATEDGRWEYDTCMIRAIKRRKGFASSREEAQQMCDLVMKELCDDNS